MRKTLLLACTFFLSVTICSAQKLIPTDPSSTEVTVLVDIKVNPAFKSETKSLVKDLISQTIKESGVVSYNYYLSPDENKVLIIEQYTSLGAFQEHGKKLFSSPVGEKFKSYFTVNSITVAGSNLPDSVPRYTIMKSIGGFGSK